MIEALLFLPASAQYPFITGGTIIVSAIISLFTDKKPTKRELLAVLIAFIGVLLLFVPDILKTLNLDFSDIEIFKMPWKI
jgi:drug/metabolite transporter (DMT)-like permease